MNNKKATYLSKHSQRVLGLQENVIKNDSIPENSQQSQRNQTSK